MPTTRPTQGPVPTPVQGPDRQLDGMPAGPADGPTDGRTGAVVLPASAHSYLTRSAASLREAVVVDDVPARYALAHVSALQAAAAYLSARSGPVPAKRRRTRNAWVLLTEVAPDLEDWARHFAAGAATYQAAQAGSVRGVSAEAAAVLVEDADRFLAVVEEALGLLPHPALVERSGVAEVFLAVERDAALADEEGIGGVAGVA